MATSLHSLARKESARVGRVLAVVVIAAFFVSARPATLSAQGPGLHYQHQGSMPPGAIGQARLQRGGPVQGYFQPVRIKAPQGTSICLAEQGRFTVARPAPLDVGLLVGQVYRIRVTNIPLRPGEEVFPTIEIVDRLYAPQGEEHQFPIPVHLNLEDLRLALAGKFVTRVIYLEDPETALPVRDDPANENWFEIGSKRDPLAVADELGRPVAILRMGGRMPDLAGGLDVNFLFSCPPTMNYPPAVRVLPPPPRGDPAEPRPQASRGTENRLE